MFMKTSRKVNIHSPARRVSLVTVTEGGLEMLPACPSAFASRGSWSVRSFSETQGVLWPELGENPSHAWEVAARGFWSLWVLCKS